MDKDKNESINQKENYFYFLLNYYIAQKFFED